MHECVFCQIIAGEAEGSIVYQNDVVVAFMDIHQLNHYKVLVVPVEHVVTVYELSDEQAAAIMKVAVKLSNIIRVVSGCEGMNLFQSNGELAGQEVFHFHLHLLPRFENDQVTFRHIERSKPHSNPGRETLDKLAADLRAKL